ncbi:unnamed protein product, partial [Meganyctiphanes norvegica]
SWHLPHICQYRYASKINNTVQLSTQINLASKNDNCISNRKLAYYLTNKNSKINHRLSLTCNYSSTSEPPNDKKNPQKSSQESSSNHKAIDYVNSSRAQMLKFMHLIKEQSQKPAVQEFGNRLTEKTSSVMKRSQDRLRSLGTVAIRSNDKHPEDWNDMLNRWIQKYQDFVGITDLKKAQERVTELTHKLQLYQSSRQNLQQELETLQEQLLINQQRITKTELYSEEHYALFEEAREINSRLKVVRKDFERSERDERETFEQLSISIRDCHERERTQAEQSKYWSIIASIVSAAIASVITSFNNWVRIREIKEHVTRSGKHLIDNFEDLQDKLLSAAGRNLVPPLALGSAVAVGSIPAPTIQNEIQHVVKEESKATKVGNEIYSQKEIKEEIKASSPVAAKEDTKPTSKDIAPDTVPQQIIVPELRDVNISKEDINHLQEVVRQTVAHEVAIVLAHSHSSQSQQAAIPPIEIKDLNLSGEDLDRIQTLVTHTLEGIKLEVLNSLVQEKRDLLHELQQEVSTSIVQEKQVLHEDLKEITAYIVQERDGILKELKDVSNSIIQERQAIIDQVKEVISSYAHDKEENVATNIEITTPKEVVETKTEDEVLLEDSVGLTEKKIIKESVALTEKKISKDKMMKEAEVILEESDLMSVESAALSSEHSFPSILSAMALGAGIGTLVTAAVLGGFDGS